jgi:pSer/pThr/pTyr-binding forkhead associated (FHA) protein
MAKLILSMDGLVLKEIPLTKDRTTIGRKPHNDIQIDNLAISGEHAAIVTILNDSFLEDLNSTNGTYVNGQPIKKHVLQPNDVIELGKYRLKYLAERVSPSAQGDYDKTIILRPEGRAAPPEPPSATAATAADAAAPAGPAPAGVTSAPTLDSAAAAQVKPIPVGVIQVLNGVNAGRELELNKTLTTLGKPGVQVAVITRRPQGYFITHVEGARRPLLNGRELDAQAQPLHDQDVVELAGVKMGFFLKK